MSRESRDSTTDNTRDSESPLAQPAGLSQLRKAVDSISKSVFSIGQSHLKLEAAHRDSAAAVMQMTATIRADLNRMHLEICDLLGGQVQTNQQAGYANQSFPPVPEANHGGFQSSADLSQGSLEALQACIQQEFQSLKGSLVSKAPSFSRAPSAIMPDEAGSSPKNAEESAQRQEEDAMVADIWEDFQLSVNRYEDHHNSFARIARKLNDDEESLWHRLFRHFGLYQWLDREMPKNCLAPITTHWVFTTFSTVLILSNTAIMGYESDCAIKAALEDPPGDKPAWLATCNLGYNLVFAVELLFRMVALRSWFWVSPEDWGWNTFDVVVVGCSLMTDFMGGVNLSFIRSFRILRAVRAVRVIRVLRFFRELRRILFAIMACIGSLLWCFLFLAMTMFMFSILTLQGIVDALGDMDAGSQEYKDAAALVRPWYGSIADSMFTLLAAFTTGNDFFLFNEPIEAAGVLYSAAYVAYMLFVMVGVMNVLTGVFLAASESFTDRSMLIQSEQMQQEAFVTMMIEVFEECDLDRNGIITWQEFSKALTDSNLQAFLSAHKFEVAHARLLYDVLDEEDNNSINLLQFVMGMLRLKGEAKAIDARIIQREIGMIPKILNPNMLNKTYRQRRAQHV